MNEETVGRNWVDEAGRVWVQVAYTSLPTASFRSVDDPAQRLGGVVGSRLLSGLRLLPTHSELCCGDPGDCGEDCAQ